MQKLKPVNSKIKTTYQKSSFIRQPRLINVFRSKIIGGIKKCLIKNVALHVASVKIDEGAMCKLQFICSLPSR